MRAKTIIPTWDELLDTAPQEILDLIEQSKSTPQGTDWHPENEVYKHIRIVFDRARETGDINITIASFFHDLGKMSTTAPNKRGGWSAYGHENVSGKLVDKHKKWVESTGAQFMKVKEIVDNHMKIKLMDEMRPIKQEAMRNLITYPELLKFAECDNMRTLTDEELNRYK